MPCRCPQPAGVHVQGAGCPAHVATGSWESVGRTPRLGRGPKTQGPEADSHPPTPSRGTDRQDPPLSPAGPAGPGAPPAAWGWPCSAAAGGLPGGTGGWAEGADSGGSLGPEAEMKGGRSPAAEPGVTCRPTAGHGPLSVHTDPQGLAGQGGPQPRRTGWVCGRQRAWGTHVGGGGTERACRGQSRPGPPATVRCQRTKTLNGACDFKGSLYCAGSSVPRVCAGPHLGPGRRKQDTGLAA